MSKETHLFASVRVCTRLQEQWLKITLCKFFRANAPLDMLIVIPLPGKGFSLMQQVCRQIVSSSLSAPTLSKQYQTLKPKIASYPWINFSQTEF
jgi:hypothetical protein